jgi:hypothetical protein
MNMKIRNMIARNMIAMVCVITGLTAGITQASTITTNTLTPYSYARFDSYGTNVGVSGPNNIIANGNTLTGLVANENADYRTIWQFQLNTLPFTSADVVTATVNWTGSPIWGGNTLGIDVVKSDFTTWNTIPMYGSGSTITTDKWNGSGSNDLTAAFNFALDNSTATSGLALRFYCAGAPGDYVAGNISNVNIVVTSVPEPSTYALVLGGIATLFLIRRRVQA